MDKVNILTRARIETRFLNQLAILTNGNLGKYIKAIAEVFGIVSEKLSTGVLDNSFQIEQNTGTSLIINPGVAISNNDDVRIMATTAKGNIDVTSLFNDTDYNIYLLPKAESYESGTLTFTNGSNIVNIINGDFSKLSAYESIVIDTSVSGNNGVYEISNVASNSVLELVNTFTGTTETSLKWKVAGNFKGFKVATVDDLIYSYDSYDILVSSQQLSLGFILATFRKSSGVIASITDKRSQNLFTIKAIGRTLADSIITGIVNAITTIEEKASAGRVNDIVADNIQSGYKTGLTLDLSGDQNKTLGIEVGVAYLASGERVEVFSKLNLDLQASLDNGDIVDGNNLLYIYYVTPSRYAFQWNSNSQGGVLIGKIFYSPIPGGEDTLFTISQDVRNPIKHKVNSVLFDEKTITEYADKELYYKKGILYYRQIDPNSRNNALREAEVINIYRLNDILNSALSSVAKSEKIRFNLYPTVEKDSWFFNNGIQSPILIGYKYRITKWKVGVLPAMTTPVGTSQVYDYTTKEVLLPSKISNIISQDLTGIVGENGTLGVYFFGSGSINTIKLVHEGNVIAETNMQIVNTDSLGQAEINKLYQVEVQVESTEDSISIPISID